MEPDTNNPIGTAERSHGTTPNERPTSSREAAQRSAEEMWKKGAEVYDQTKQAASQAYDRAASTVSSTYDQAVTYGRDNPGKLTLIAFGAGIGIGLLLAGGGGRARTRRYAEPVVNALYDIALEFFRHR
jgi:ElaB/YqjD/DUF883 family membrane-anchored ribosome-binding protein